MLEVLSCFVTITYLDFQEFFLFLQELSFILRHMVTQAHSQKSCIMRTAHVMLNLAKYRIMLSLHYIEEHNIAEHHIA